VSGNLFVSLDAKGSDGVLGLGLAWNLIGKIGEDLSGLGELIAGLTGTKVQDELVNLDLSHLVVELSGILLLVHFQYLLSKPAKLINNNWTSSISQKNY